MPSNIPLTILVVSYNNFNYIFETLDSIFEQTYNNIQLIISDDASSYFDKDILQSYINKKVHPGIKEIIINVNDVNMGTVRHIEKLHKMATGELITVIAADDKYADKCAIEWLVNEYNSYEGKVPIITSLLAMSDSKLKKIKSIFTSPEQVQLINSANLNKLFEEMAYHCFIPSSGTIVKKAIYDKYGSIADKYTYVEDWSSHLIWVRNGELMRCVNKVTVLHRDGGISHGNKRVDYEVFLKYYRDLLTIFEQEIEPYSDLLSNSAYKKAVEFYNYRKTTFRIKEAEFKNSNKKKIVFYIRKGLSAKGDYLMYYRMARYISDNYPEYAVYCINNPLQQLVEQYDNGKIVFANINNDMLAQLKDATFITAYNQLYYLLDEIHSLKNVKLLLLFLHPQMMNWMDNQLFLKHYNSNSILKMLKDYDAYAFMDISNNVAVETKANMLFEKRFLPVSIDNDSTELVIRNKGIEENEINIGWLGRVDFDKVFSIINFIDNIIDNYRDKNINLHIIGSGNAVFYLIKAIENYHANIRVFFNSYLYGEKRNKYIINNVDLMIAMGISAIDSALLKIPTVIPIVSNTRFRNDKMMYLFETQDFCLGWDLDYISKIEGNTVSANEIMNDIFINNKKLELGEKCYNYVKDTFSIEKQINANLNLINNTKLTIGRILKNRSVFYHFGLYWLIKKVYSLKGYEEYAGFKEKFNKIKELSFREKIIKIKRVLVRIIRKVFNKIKRILGRTK